MRQALTLTILVLGTLRVGAAVGQAETQLSVRIRADDTCLVYLLRVPCRDVGTKLLELGTPSDVHIHVNATSDASHESIEAAISSLKSAGFQIKLDDVKVWSP